MSSTGNPKSQTEHSGNRLNRQGGEDDGRFTTTEGTTTKDFANWLPVIPHLRATVSTQRACIEEW